MPRKLLSDEVKKTGKADILAARIRELEREIADYKEIATEARALDTPQLAAAVAALKSVSLLREQVAHHRAEIKALGITDPIEHLAFMRSRASAAGSWVAAKDLYREEREVIAERDAAAKRAAEEAAKDIPALLEEMDRILTDLPEALRVQLLAKWVR